MFPSPHIRSNSRGGGGGRGRDNTCITVWVLGEVLGWGATPQEMANLEPRQNPSQSLTPTAPLRPGGPGS